MISNLRKSRSTKKQKKKKEKREREEESRSTLSSSIPTSRRTVVGRFFKNEAFSTSTLTKRRPRHQFIIRNLIILYFATAVLFLVSKSEEEPKPETFLLQSVRWKPCCLLSSRELQSSSIPCTWVNHIELWRRDQSRQYLPAIGSAPKATRKEKSPRYSSKPSTCKASHR
ncbi:hypothetical protein Bca4012_083551 [Brassica carinata]